jgi:metal-responsive CopG/Arc/MetJ family transcriptional regulator
MKTIAITIDDAILRRLERVSGSSNRSKLIRAAVEDYLARLERAAAEEHEAAILRRHRGRLARQAAAAVRVQARP